MNQTKAALPQIEAFSQLLMDSNPQYIFWKDINSVYLGCNQLYADMLALESTEAIVGRTDAQNIKKDEAGVCTSADRAVMKNGNVLLNFEEQITDGHGVTRWFNINKIPLKDKEGKVIGVLGTMEDISESKKNKELIKEQSKTLKTQLEKLQSKNKELEEFNYIVAHDLQEPVRNISNFGNLMAKEGAYNEEFMKYVLGGAERISFLLDALLSYYVLGNQERDLQQVDLNVVVDSALEQLKSKFQESEYDVDVQSLPKIDGLKVELVSLFQNLISNSIKYRAEDRPCKIVISTLEENEEQVVIAIEDNGIGMEQAQCERAMKIFQRLHNNKDITGTGIGLSICTKIMCLHNGNLQIESQVGRGTKISLTFNK